MPDDEFPSAALAPHPVEILVVIVFLVVAAIIVTVLVRGVRQWTRNNAAPVVTTVARVVAKRTDVWGGRNASGAHTSYFATFEAPTGERWELPLPAAQFGLVAEGDVGNLTYQSTRFQSFDRTSIASR